MSISHALSRRLFAAAAVWSMVAATAPAHAGVIASFDPAFGPAIPNLGFRGSITLDVTPGCYTLGSGFHATGGSCQITAQSGVIDYYNASTNSNVLTTVTLGGFASNYVFGAYFDPLTGQLAGLDTNDSAQFAVSVTDSNPVAPINYANGAMLLYFSSGTQPIQIRTLALNPGPVTPTGSIAGVGGAYLVKCSTNVQQQGFCASGDPSTTSFPGRLTFTTVPEPGSISLALIGLVGLAVTRRRSRKASVRRNSAL